MPYLGGPYVPHSALEGVVKHVYKRARDAYEEHSNVAKQQKLEERFGSKRKRDSYDTGEEEYKRSRSGRSRSASKMPLVRRRFRPRRSRRSYRRKALVRRARRLPPARYLWEPSRLVKFTAVNYATYTGTSGAIGAVVLKANSLNDPFGGTGAELPLGLDQWAALYSKYKVVSSMIKVDAHPLTITGSAIIGVHCTDDSSALTDYKHYAELPHTRVQMVSPDIDIARLAVGYSARKMFNIKDLRDNSQIEGNFTTTPGDPTKIAYYHVFVQDGNSTETVTVELMIRITYTVLLFDRIMPARSSL